MWELYIFIWLLLGSLSAYLAHKKDKDWKWAFLMGCTFGILALIYYVFCRKGGVTCKHCAELISKKAKVCRWCGKDVIISVENKEEKTT